MRVDDVGSTTSTTTSPVTRPTVVAPPPPPAIEQAEAMVEQATPIGSTRPDIPQLAAQLSSAKTADPQAARQMRAAVESYLTPVETGQLSRELSARGGGGDGTDGWSKTIKDKPPAIPRSPYDIDRNGIVTTSEAVAVTHAHILKSIGMEPPVSHLHLRDADYEGIPQGQGYDAGTNEFLTTYYAKDVRDVRLSIQDKATGYETSYVKLTDENGAGLGHGGGVAQAGKWVFVSDSEKVYAYDRAKIEAASPGATLMADTVTEAGASSFMNVSPDGKYAYVGEFDRNVLFKEDTAGWPELHRYEIDQASGALINHQGPVKIPNNAQGVAVTDEGLIFTTSYGNIKWISPKEVIFQKFAKDPSEGFALEDRDDAKTLGEIPYYAEGANVIGDRLYVTHESGAEKYEGKDGIGSIQSYKLDDFDW